jgi:hypothetical protein
LDWLFTDQYATLRITMDPSGSVRGLTVNERQIVDLILSTLKEKASPLVEQYFWRGSAKIPLTFYYPKALTVTSTSRGVVLSSTYVLEKGCISEKKACPKLGYSFTITSISSINSVQDKCWGVASSTIPNILEVVLKKDALAACSQTGPHYAWVYEGEKGMYAIAVDRSGDTFDVPYGYAEKELITTLKEK